MERIFKPIYLCGLLKILIMLTFKQTCGFAIDLGQTVAFWLYLIWLLMSRTSVKVKPIQDLVHRVVQVPIFPKMMKSQIGQKHTNPYLFLQQVDTN